MLHDDSDLKCICMATLADINIYQKATEGSISQARAIIHFIEWV